MWRLGYLLWRTWLYTRVGVFAALVLVLLYQVNGPSWLFTLALVGTVGMVAGMRLVLRDLARLEHVGTGWRR